MTALYCDPHELAGILRERQESYEFVARGSVGYYEKTLDFGAWVAGKRSQCAHGVWMKTLRELGWSYSVCNRAIKLHTLGVSAAELARDGAKAVLKRFARPRRPAGAGEAKFSAGAKFAEPLETPPGAGEADPDPAEFSAGAKFEPPPTASEPAEAPAPPDEFEEPVPEGGDVAEGDADAIEAAWQAVRERLHGELGDDVFKSWIKNFRMEARGDGAALLAPKAFIRDRVRQNWGDRIRDLWKQALPDVELDFRVETGAPKAQRNLPLPDGAADGRTWELFPKNFDLGRPADRMLFCLGLDTEPREARETLAVLTYFDGGQGAFPADEETLAAHQNISVRTLQRRLRACEAAGYLRTTVRRNNYNLYRVFPEGAPIEAQRSAAQGRLALLRSFDSTHAASPAEAAEAAAARPRTAELNDTRVAPGVTPVSKSDDAGVAPKGGVDAAQNRKETGIEHAADAPPAPAKRGRRAAG